MTNNIRDKISFSMLYLSILKVQFYTGIADSQVPKTTKKGELIKRPNRKPKDII